MNVIIIAALALLVLVVLTVIFLGRVGTFGAETADCQNKGGKCLASCAGDPDGYTTQFSAWKCTADTDVCCIKTGV